MSAFSTKPNKKDLAGVLIEVGDEVAYNLSGMVGRGIVERISASYRYSHKRWCYHIRCEVGYRSKVGQISKVTNSHNLLVLRKVVT